MKALKAIAFLSFECFVGISIGLLIGGGCSLADLTADLLASDPSTSEVVHFLVDFRFGT